MKNTISVVAMTLLSTQALADYNANLSGKLAQVLTYADNDSIFIQLQNQPSSHPACNASYFVIDASVPSERKKMMLSRLLVSYASGENITIGYDDTGTTCAAGYIRVYRIG